MDSLNILKRVLVLVGILINYTTVMTVTCLVCVVTAVTLYTVLSLMRELDSLFDSLLLSPLVLYYPFSFFLLIFFLLRARRYES